MNCPLSTIDDILDFTSLAQEAVKVMEREERVANYVAYFSYLRVKGLNARSVRN